MYEYTKRGIGMTREVSGLGYSDYTRWGNIDWCMRSPSRADSRMLCFVDNDVLDQTTAERAGCTRANKRTWFNFGPLRDITCETNSDNSGHVWCCPPGAVRDMPMTQAERDRATELLLAEQRAREEGRLPGTAPADEAKGPTITIGESTPIAAQETIGSTISKITSNPLWIVAAVAMGFGTFMGYKYYTKSKQTHSRRMAFTGAR